MRADRKSVVHNASVLVPRESIGTGGTPHRAGRRTPRGNPNAGFHPKRSRAGGAKHRSPGITRARSAPRPTRPATYSRACDYLIRGRILRSYEGRRRLHARSSAGSDGTNCFALRTAGERTSSMSTKATLASGQKFHFYADAWGEDAVWLSIESDRFEVSERGATIRIPIAIWENIRAVPSVRFDVALKSARELKQLAHATAHENRARYREHVRSQRGRHRHKHPSDSWLFPRSDRSAARILADLRRRKRRQQRILRAIGRLSKCDPRRATSVA